MLVRQFALRTVFARSRVPKYTNTSNIRTPLLSSTNKVIHNIDVDIKYKYETCGTLDNIKKLMIFSGDLFRI